MIEAFHVGAVSRGRILWEGFTLAVGKSEMWIVAGPPSCGKTLLMRILRGERRPDSGDVVVGGESLYRGSPEHNRRFRADSGVVPESFPREAGKTVVDLFRRSALAAEEGVPAAEQEGRIAELLPLVGLSGAEGEEVSSLSASERTRVALAVELFRNPRYLFLDMVLANVGSGWADRLGGLLRALAREERTILMMERQLPEKWQAERVPSPRPAGPFLLYRLGGPRPARMAAAEPPPFETLPEKTGGGK
jgi:ABC-type multidrug transport system ATPase subunit